MFLLVSALLTSLMLMTSTPASAARTTPAEATGYAWDSEQPVDDADAALADKYRPFIGIQTLQQPCGPGESYLPTDALLSIDRPDVVLRDSSGAVIATSPTANDLATAPNNAFIDYPGNALDPGCDYERWFAKTGPPPPAVHGRVLTDPDHPGLLVVQYWIYWVFNDWNNNHEGDWEMMQIIFEADSAEEALTTEPVDVVVAQHEGAQQAPWERVEQRDGRPVVYAAEGAHATFFSQGNWLGKSGEAGFGCDDTRAPTTILDPTVIMMPDRVDPTGPFGWLLWEGRWGERRPLFNNGSTGPVVKQQWDSPITWTNDTARDSNIKVPNFGNATTDFFCAATARGSVLLLKFFNSPLAIGLVLAATLLVLVLLARGTVWGPRVLRPVAARRRGGQILRSAMGLLVAERRRFAPIAGLIVVGGVAASIVRRLVLLIPSMRDANTLVKGDEFSGVILALLAGTLITIPVGIIALSLATAVTADLDSSPDRTSLGSMVRHRGLGRVIALVVIVAVSGVILGPFSLPIAAYLVARWAAAPTISLRGSSLRDALRESADLTRGRRWKTGGLSVIAITLATTAGPLLGLIAWTITGASLTLVNLFTSVVAAVTLPWLAVVIVMIHGDLDQSRAQSDAEELH